jgi:hypothetical protein
MRQYCKAYTVAQLRQFQGWDAMYAKDVALSDEDICFLWDDFSLQAHTPFSEEKFVASGTAPEWQDFCRQHLGFEVPEDIHEMNSLADAPSL